MPDQTQDTQIQLKDAFIGACATEVVGSVLDGQRVQPNTAARMVDVAIRDLEAYNDGAHFDEDGELNIETLGSKSCPWTANYFSFGRDEQELTAQEQINELGIQRDQGMNAIMTGPTGT
ncbi:MAG: hypothetical protein AB7E85_03980 [Pseudobdellovibrionaceae bacterium]